LKAIILNSGIGKRLEELTKNKPKCMVDLYNNETILERQIRILKKYGIKNYIITTGPFQQQMKDLCNKKFKELNIKFVHNDKYDSTNYIYSIYLAKKSITNEQIIMMHGDLVFDENLIKEITKTQIQNIGLINKKEKLPEKDFKAKIIEEKIIEISVNLSSQKNVYTFMPLYKLDKQITNLWLEEIEKYINQNNVNVYAEEALNQITNEIQLNYFEYSNYYCKEIDDKKDLETVNKEIEGIDKNESS